MILQRLNEIEKEQDFKIVFAAEGGSRAWDIASTGSDYDVRFIYVYPTHRYLALNPPKDSFNRTEGDIDFSGWDIRKAAKLFANSNVSIHEWLDSLIIYKSTYVSMWLEMSRKDYFDPRTAASHYVNMANGLFSEHVFGDRPIKTKKAIYIIRSLLAARWIVGMGTFPPLPFNTLLQYSIPDIPPGVTDDIQAISNAKVSGVAEVVLSESLKGWIETELISTYHLASELVSNKRGTLDSLDQYVRDIILDFSRSE